MLSESLKNHIKHMNASDTYTMYDQSKGNIRLKKNDGDTVIKMTSEELKYLMENNLINTIDIKVFESGKITKCKGQSTTVDTGKLESLKIEMNNEIAQKALMEKMKEKNKIAAQRNNPIKAMISIWNDFSKPSKRTAKTPAQNNNSSGNNNDNSWDMGNSNGNTAFQDDLFGPSDMPGSNNGYSFNNPNFDRMH